MRRPLVFLLSLLVVAAVVAGSLHPNDAAALADLRRSLRDLPGSSFFSTWRASSDPCSSFSGVVCGPDPADPAGDGPLRVIVLTLGSGLAASPGLAGTLPASLSLLAGLTDLVLFPGRVAGPVPGNLSGALRLVSLSGNRLCGTIHPSFAALPELHTLDLSGNLLSGPIPPSLFLPSSSLKVLILAGNGGLVGGIPPDVADSQLYHLDLSRNSLSGDLPQLPSTLRYLSLSNNSLSGDLATAFTSANVSPPDLSFLDLSMNAFSGRVPPAIFSLPTLSTILLDRNNLSGPITVDDDAAPATWSVVDLSHNAITGEIPPALAAASSVYVNNNRMTGAVPAAVLRSLLAGTMTTLYAQHNFLTGFPSSVSPLPLPEAAILCLSYNCMELPSAAAAGCPATSGPTSPRPPDQCPGDDSGGNAADGPVG